MWKLVRGSPAPGLCERHSSSARPLRAMRRSTLQGCSGGFSNGQEVCVRLPPQNSKTALPFSECWRHEAAREAPARPQLSGPVSLWHILGHLRLPALHVSYGVLRPLETAHEPARGNSLQPRTGGDRLGYAAQLPPPPGGTPATTLQ